jgi:hypothetical protein
MSLEVSIPCDVCSAQISLGAQFCPGCGRAVTDQDRAVLQVRLEGADHQAFERGTNVRKASRWIGVLAVMYAVSGTMIFVMQKIKATEALDHLAQFEDDDQLKPIDGKSYTAGELRREVAREPYVGLVSNLILCVSMAGLWWWGRRAPLPAIACAFAMFLVVIIVNAVVSPASLASGIIVKIAAIGVLSKGLKSALAARAALRRPAS